MDNISDLEFFAQIVREGSLTAAAREMGSTTSSVSKRLTQIERRIGVRLLNRSTRALSMTMEGALYFERGALILGDLTNLEQTIARSRVEPAGLLRVNASYGFGRAFVAPAISTYLEAHPAMQIQLQLTDRPVNLADEGFDLCVRFGPAPDARVVAKLLRRNRRVVCASRKYLKTHGIPETPDDLSRHQCLVLRENDNAFGVWQFERGTERKSVKVQGQASTNDGDVVLQWALEGRGIVMRSEWQIAALLGAGRLVPVLTEWSLPDADIYGVYSEHNRQSERLRRFLKFLQARIGAGLDSR